MPPPTMTMDLGEVAAEAVVVVMGDIAFRVCASRL